MIHQHFSPISSVLNLIQSNCYSGDDPYFTQQYSLDAAEVSTWILSNKKLLESTLDCISEMTDDDKIADYVRNLAPERRFILYTAIQIAYLHFDADTAKLPLIPPKNFYVLVAAYVQEGFLSFERHCRGNKLLLWDQVLTYELKMAVDQNF